MADDTSQLTDDELRQQYNDLKAEQVQKQNEYKAWSTTAMYRAFNLADQMDKRGLKP